MSKNEAFWFILYISGVALLAVPRGWREMCWNVGAGICFYILGRAYRDSRKKS